MKPVETNMARLLVVAIGLVVGLAGYAGAEGPADSAPARASAQSEVLPRTPRAIEAEAAIARTDLGARMEAALGDGFGGVWFEPVTAQMQVAVTSPAAGRLAETVAGGAGLSEIVTEVPVASSWAQLDAAQARWDRRLADLFKRSEVATALLPDRNAVSIELGSSVPSSTRETLEQAAAADSVEVEIGVAAQSRLGADPMLQCAAFKKHESHCDPTIVAGVTIVGPWVAPAEKLEEGEDEAEAEQEQQEANTVRNKCTAGPAVVLKDALKKEDQTKTYILTAGHCINEAKDGGGVKGKWTAFTKNKTPHEIGEAVAYIDNKTDVGLIEVKTNIWAKAKNVIPVVPGVAYWTAAESTPLPVIDQKKPMLKTMTCKSGQTTGSECGGEIITTDQTLNLDGGIIIENLMEVKGIKQEKGDSGGPWFNEAEYKKTTAFVEGTTVGRKFKTNNPVFEPLEISFEKLKNEKGFDLALLTTKNEKRHGKMKAGKYPATIHGSTTAGEKFTVGSSSVECKSDTYHGTLSEPSSTLTVTPEYKNCTASFGVGATVTMEGCTYVLHVAEKASTDNYRAYTDISCPAGKSIKISAPIGCKLEIKAQNEIETSDLVDDTSASPKKDVTFRPTMEKIVYTVTEDGPFCPLAGLGEKGDGKFTSTENTTWTAQNPSESSEKIDVEIADE